MKRGDRQWLLVKGKDQFAERGWKLETILKGAKRRKRATVKKRDARAGKRSMAVSTSRESSDLHPIAVTRAFEARALSGNVRVEVKRNVVELTNLDKVYWPDEGYTKGDLIKYYYGIAPHLLPYLKDRPLILKRFPEGIAADFFYQHDVDKAPDYIRTSEIEVREGHQVDYIIGGTIETLLYTANLGAIEQHPWHSRVRQMDRPDWIVFDLDPGDSVKYSTVCEVALSVRDVLKRMSIDCYAKTSGARGMHVYIPIRPAYDYEQVAEFAESVAGLVAGENPQIATIERSLNKRKRGQVYVDHLQNARGKSIAAPYSARPKPGATVAAPLNWGEIERGEISPLDFTIKNMVKRVGRKGDLFAPVLTERQNLGGAMKRIRKG
jgi:DNA ligase D